MIAGLLALGLAAVTVTFSLFDAILLRPLPVRQPEELVRIVQHLPKLGAQTSFPYSYYQAVHDHATALVFTFGEAGKYYHFVVNDPAPAEEITLRAVTPDFFDGMGAQALSGRLLRSDDADAKMGMPAAVLSYGFWRRRFGGDPRGINGKTVAVNGHHFVIVGVAARDFNGVTVDTSPDLWIPLSAYSPLVSLSKDQMSFELGGRLKSGFTRSQAEAECRTIWHYTMKDYYKSVEKESEQAASVLVARGIDLEPLERGVSILRDNFADVLKLLMAAVSLLLLIVCFNVGGLLLARAAARQHEFAVRLATGATRFRLVRQVLAESFMFAALGGAGGLLIAMVAIPLAVRMLPPMRDLGGSLVPLALHASINREVFFFALGLSVLAMVLFSLSPAVVVFRSTLDCLLRAGRSSGSTRGRQVLITFQIATCTFLLVIAGLFVRTFLELERVDPGFDRDHMATFSGDLSGYTGGDPSAFLGILAERVRELPGVASVAISSRGLMRGHGVFSTIAAAGDRITRADFLDAGWNTVSPEYFQTMGMRLLFGRDFIASDGPGPKHAGPIMAVVNQAFAGRFFPNGYPVGKRFGTGIEGVANDKYQIVGVVSDAKYRSMREPIVPTFYTVETHPSSFVLNVRTLTRPAGVIEPVRKALASIDPSLSFLEVHTMNEEIDNSVANERLTAQLASMFGAIAALFVGSGVYALLAYVVTQRRREIGIRMALGAQRADVLRIILGQGIKLAGVGVGIGLVWSLALTRFIASLLYGVKATDPLTFVVVAVALIGVVLLASYIPARRAAKVDPMVALRYE